MTAGSDALLRRLERDALVAAAVLAAAAVAIWPDRPGRAAGVLGGFALVAVSYQGIRAGVAGLWPEAPGGPASAPFSPPPGAHGDAGQPAETPAGRPGRGFVKFFTRHAILAVGAYVMMARFDVDPMAMLVGVTVPAVAASVEIVRTVRARHGGPHSS